LINRAYPLVTIAIPTYNRADSYLKQSLGSAVHQTYPNIEIIVSDNCSTDSTEAVVQSFNDSRIRYFKQEENIGAFKNFNFCVQESTGDYFLLLGDDDLIDNDFVEICVKAADYSTDVGIIRTGTRTIDSQGRLLTKATNRVDGLPTEGFFRGWFAGKTALYPCSTLFNAKRLKEIGGFKPENNLFLDGFVIVKLAAKFGRVDVRDIKASFRKHPSEMTFAANVGDWCEDSLMLLELMCDLISENKALVRSEGMRFFSKINYSRAKAVRSPLNRLIAYLMVLRKFNYRYFPNRSHFLSPIYNLFRGTPIYSGLRFIRGKMKQVLATK